MYVSINDIKNWIHSNKKYNLMVFAPRNSGKTTLASKTLPDYLLELFPKSRICYLTKHQLVAKKLEKEFRYNGSNRIKFSFVGDPCNGQRFDYIIMDDLGTDHENNFKLWSWYMEIVLTRLAPGGKQFYIGTSYNNDIYDNDLPNMIFYYQLPNWDYKIINKVN